MWIGLEGSLIGMSDTTHVSMQLCREKCLNIIHTLLMILLSLFQTIPI